MKKQKKYYLIYQITNNLNHKIYIGKHKTDCLDDDYFGSGKHLRNAQKKYGLENFTKTILCYCANEEEMNLLEKMVVTKEFCDREDTYNIKEGGDGGWDYVNLSSDYRAGTEKRQQATKKVKEFYSVHENAIVHSKAISNGMQDRLNNMTPEEREIERQQNSKKAIDTGFSQAFLGKHHSEKTRQQISQTKQENPLIGEKNGVFGKHWYYDPHTLKAQLFFEGQQPSEWIKGQKPPKPKPQYTAHQLKQREQYAKMYAVYQVHGFEAIINEFQYPYTQANFVQQCKKHVPSFVPQMGKQRKTMI